MDVLHIERLLYYGEITSSRHMYVNNTCTFLVQCSKILQPNSIQTLRMRKNPSFTLKQLTYGSFLYYGIYPYLVFAPTRAVT